MEAYPGYVCITGETDTGNQNLFLWVMYVLPILHQPLGKKLPLPP